MTIIFELAIKCFKFVWLFHFTKMLTKQSLKESTNLSNIFIPQLISAQVITYIRSDKIQSISLLLIMENCLPFTDDVMVVLVHKCLHETHILALH